MMVTAGDQEDWGTRLEGGHINAASHMATDYLNHFNEAIMLLDMLPEMPEGITDLAAWHPITYTEHFTASRLAYAPLAVEAFAAAPAPHRRALDLIVDRLNAGLLDVIDAVVMATGSGQPELACEAARVTTPDLRRLVQLAADVMNGERLIEGPADIERHLQDGSGMSQDDVDSLFA